MGRRVHGEAGDVVDAVLPEAGVGAGRPQRVRDGHGGAEAAPAHVQVHVLTRVHAADGRQHPPAPLPVTEVHSCVDSVSIGYSDTLGVTLPEITVLT